MNTFSVENSGDHAAKGWTVWWPSSRASRSQLDNNPGSRVNPTTAADEEDPCEVGDQPRNINKKLLIRALQGILLLGFAAGVITYVVWVIHLVQNVPDFQVQVNSLKVSSLNVTNFSQITANLDVNVTVFKSKGLQVSRLDHVEVNILCNNEYVAGTIFEPVYLGFHGSKLLNATLSASSHPISDYTAVLVNTEKAYGFMRSFKVELKATVVERRYLITADCGVGVKIASDMTTGTGAPNGSCWLRYWF